MQLYRQKCIQRLTIRWVQNVFQMRSVTTAFPLHLKGRKEMLAIIKSQYYIALCSFVIKKLMSRFPAENRKNTDLCVFHILHPYVGNQRVDVGLTKAQGAPVIHCLDKGKSRRVGGM